MEQLHARTSTTEAPDPVVGRLTRRRNSAPEQVVITRAGSGLFEVVAVADSATRATVQLDGELDFATCALITRVLADQLTRGHRFVTLDLSRLTFLDCAGVGALVRAHHQFLAANGTLGLTGAGRLVRRVLTATGLDATMSVVEAPHETMDPARWHRHLTVVGEQ